MRLTIESAQDPWSVWFADNRRQMPWWHLLDEIAEADCEWMEPGSFGYLPTDPKVLRTRLDKRDLNVGDSFPWASR
jgi:inosose dehydratase